MSSSSLSFHPDEETHDPILTHDNNDGDSNIIINEQDNTEISQATCSPPQEPLSENLKETPLPWRIMAPMMLIMLGESISITMLFPWVALMINSFGIAKNPTQIGFYAGLVASSFSLAQTLSSYPIGHLSDRIGRRPVIILGSLGGGISMCLFGFSPTFAFALSFRFLGGLTNGNLGVLKAVLTEITDSTNRTRAFTIPPLCWGIGSILGPSFGGFLVYPADKYPNTFPRGSFFDQHPFALPCLFSSSVYFFAVFVFYFVLPETNKNAIPFSVFIKFLFSKDNQVSAIPEEEEEEESSIQLQPQDSLEQTAKSSVDNNSVVSLSSYETDETVKSFDTPIDNLVEDEVSLQEKHFEKSSLSMKQLCSNKVLVICIVCYCCVGFGFIGINEVTPLWVFQSPNNGGLGMGSTDIGALYIIMGVTQLFYQGFFINKVIKKLGGPRPLIIFGSLICICNVLLTPWLNNLVSPSMDRDHSGFGEQSNSITTEVGVTVWILYIFIALTRVLGGASAFTGSMIVVNNSVPQHLLGAGNGLAQMCVSAFRTIGPTLYGVIFSWSLDNGLSYPFNFHFVWLCMAIVFLILFVYSRKLPHTINIAYETARELPSFSNYFPDSLQHLVHGNA